MQYYQLPVEFPNVGEAFHTSFISLQSYFKSCIGSFGF
jgi:hypothetical protein